MTAGIWAEGYAAVGIDGTRDRDAEQAGIYGLELDRNGGG